jgi:molybdenum cofactor cytidylyltransferase
MIDCIIPAAGLSKRMGQWKPLLPLHNKTIIEWSISNAIAGGCRIILVTGRNAKQLQKFYKNNPAITLIENQNYSEGLLNSIKVGLSKVSTSHFFVSLADMPFILPDIYQKLLLMKSSKIIFPKYQEKMGHPVLIPTQYIERIIQFQNSTRLKPLLCQLPHQTIGIKSKGIHFDIDTQQDYHQALKQAEDFLA